MLMLIFDVAHRCLESNGAGGPSSSIRGSCLALGWRLVTPKMEAMGHTDPLGITAHNVARELRINRERPDIFALASHAKAIAARERLADELVPVNGAAVVADECPLEDTSIEKLAALRPAFAPDGTVTAGNSSPLDDGAAAVILTSERYAANHGLTPTARFLGAAVAGCSLG